MYSRDGTTVTTVTTCFEVHVCARGMPNGAPGFWEAFPAWTRCRWIGPGRGWVDPVKEATAAALRIDSGLSTLQDEAAEQGRDWEETLEQLALERELRAEFGLSAPAAKDGKNAKDEEDDPDESDRRERGALAGRISRQENIRRRAAARATR